MAAHRGQFEAEEDELKLLIAQEQTAADRVRQNREEMARSRKGRWGGRDAGQRFP